MTLRNKAIFCVGGATVDRKLKSHSQISFATSNPVSTYFTFGGVARNVAHNLSRWTQNIFLQTLIGDDSEGEKLFSDLKNLKINTQFIRKVSDTSTARYTAILQPNGEMILALAEMTIFDFFSAEDIFIWNAWPCGSIIFIDTNLPSEIIIAAIAKAKEKKFLICVDPVSIFKAKKLPTNLENIFLLKPNRLEAEALTNIKINSHDDAIAAAIKLHERGCQNIVLTLEDDGYVIVNANMQKHFSLSQKIKLIDPTGAGDSFMAGIIFCIQQNASIEEACEFGAKAATKVIQSHDNVIDFSN